MIELSYLFNIFIESSILQVEKIKILMTFKRIYIFTCGLKRNHDDL